MVLELPTSTALFHAAGRWVLWVIVARIKSAYCWRRNMGGLLCAAFCVGFVTDLRGLWLHEAGGSARISL